jgi:hypothetical protein
MNSKNKKKDKIVNFILEHQTEEQQETILIDGHESAFVGYTPTADGLSAVYSFDKIIDGLMEDGMTYEDADEFFCYNIERGIDYVTGAVKPTILYPYENNS